MIGQEIETIDDTSISSMESVKSKIEANTTNEDSKINQNKDQQTGSNTPENVEFEPSYYEAYDDERSNIFNSLMAILPPYLHNERF